MANAKKIVHIGVVTPEVEDGGMAMIADLGAEQKGSDGCFFIKLHSWDEDDAFCEGSDEENAKCGHPIMNSLVGKKVRVTIEVVE